MSLIITLPGDKDPLFKVSKISVLVRDYNKLVGALDDTKAAAFAIMKSKIGHGEWSQLCKELGVTTQTANKYVKMHEDFLINSNRKVPYDLPETVTQHDALIGNTAEERQEHFQRVVRETGNPQPSSRTISDNTTDMEAAVEARIQAMTQLNITEADIASESILNNSMDLYTNLITYSGEWTKCRKDLLKLAHPDAGGSKEAFQIVKILDTTFEADKIIQRKIGLREQLSDLTATLKKQILKDNK